MKVALITTPPVIRSGIGDYTRHLLPYLREHAEVDLFVEPGLECEEAGETYRSAALLDPRAYAQVLYQLGNERAHAFMPRMIRTIGGTVMQHDWVLFDMALAAFPGLARGGAKGHALAVREGGLHQARIYSQNWIDRRRQRLEPDRMPDDLSSSDCFLAGWHDPEPGGRWTADRAIFRLPAEGVRRVVVEGVTERSRTVHLHLDGRSIGRLGEGRLEVDLDGSARPLLELETSGITVSKDQRRHGDARRLGCCVQRIAWLDAEGEHELDLSLPAAHRIRTIGLSRDRFRLPLNRSVVRFADAFLVHSRYVHDRILAERNAKTAIGILHHGSERRWSEEDRRAVRTSLELPDDWVAGFLVTSFGGVQAHKRIEKVLEGVALARRERPDVRLVLAGSIVSEDVDARALAARYGLENAVHFTGFVPEREGWRWLQAGDVAVNLRGPSSGGTSGGIFQAFSVSRAVIASDAAEQRELPESCVLRVPLGEDEAPRLARHLIELRDDPARRDRLEREVRRFVESECHWSIVARRYAEYLGSFPCPRVSRRKLIALRVELDR